MAFVYSAVVSSNKYKPVLAVISRSCLNSVNKVCACGVSVAEGLPARIVRVLDDGIDLTDLEGTLSPNSWLCTERKWFELYQERGPIEQLL